MRSGLDFDGDFHEDNTKYEDGITLEQMKVMQKEYYKRAQKEAEDIEEARRKNYFGLVTDAPFDSKAFNEQTAREVAEFNRYAAERDRKERDRVEHENSLAFVKATPRYIVNPTNGNNMRAYLKEHNLPATVNNLAKAYEHLQPILELKPETIAPARVYSEKEVWTMPLESGDDWGFAEGPVTLEQVCKEVSQHDSKLNGSEL